MRISLEEACNQLCKGGVVAIPTETVYGLAASLSYPDAIKQIFSLKKRPADNPLIIHVADRSMVREYIKNVPPDFERLATVFWPGPMTVVLPVQTDKVPRIVRADLSTVAFRIPNHPLTLEVLNRVGPLVMPSANLSGKPSATQPEHVESDFGKNFPVLDGGECSQGLESTILIFQEETWKIARLGSLSSEMLAPVLGYPPPVIKNINSERPICPGHLYRHYAPHAKLILDPQIKPETIGTIVGFSDRSYPPSCHLIPLGKSSDPQKVAKNLYRVLRLLDAKAIKQAWVDMDFPSSQLWITIRERLKKAAS